MKKLLLGLILCAGLTLCSCSDSDNADGACDITPMLYYKQITVDNHKYIVFSRRGGGVSAIHAESCDCKNNVMFGTSHVSNKNINKED